MANLLSRRSLWQRIKDVALTDVGVLARGGVDGDTLERLEQTLLEADLGVPVTMRLVDAVRAKASKGVIRTAEDFRGTIRDLVSSALQSGNATPTLATATSGPTVILVLGVNGAGKTTTIGKLAARFRKEGKTVLLGAGDTFRAGAIDQLKVWAERTGAEFIGATAGADPAAVAFQSIDAGIARGVDVIIVDTAGRLHTSGALMDELRKVHRVVAKRLEGAPHEALLVLDGTVGQNAVQQAKQFAEVVPLTGLVVTKLDGTARGGVVVAVHEAVDVPVKFLGLGEQAADLLPFEPARFAAELLEG
ncbi:MAG: signal recognition particle-docking protein FtsY [Gemmatimonadaceae bacterium]|nr:signal recognition particle-docking protein FtsY [Gemmatimonadaceae bacterium]